MPLRTFNKDNSSLSLIQMVLNLKPALDLTFGRKVFVYLQKLLPVQNLKSHTLNFSKSQPSLFSISMKYSSNAEFNTLVASISNESSIPVDIVPIGP